MEYDTEEERRVAAAYKEAWVCHVWNRWNLNSFDKVMPTDFDFS